MAYMSPHEGMPELAVPSAHERALASDTPVDQCASNPVSFQHGVASGDPLPTSVLIWTRLTPKTEFAPGAMDMYKVREAQRRSAVPVQCDSVLS